MVLLGGDCTFILFFGVERSAVSSFSVLAEILFTCFSVVSPFLVAVIFCAFILLLLILYFSDIYIPVFARLTCLLSWLCPFFSLSPVLIVFFWLLSTFLAVFLVLFQWVNIHYTIFLSLPLCIIAQKFLIFLWILFKFFFSILQLLNLIVVSELHLYSLNVF